MIAKPQAATMEQIARAVLAVSGEPVLEGIPLVGDERVKFVGRRPGEKMHEDIISPHELRRTNKFSVHGEWWAFIDGPNANPGLESDTALSSDRAELVDHHVLRGWIEDSLEV